MKKLLIIFCAFALILGMSGLASANTIPSSTMYFLFELGDLSLGADGWYGTVAAEPGTYYMPYGDGTHYNTFTDQFETPDGSPANGGFDVYAKEGGTAYVDRNGDGDFGDTDESWTIGSDNDAYSAGGPWGTFYDPDVPDYYNYQLELTGTTWALRGFANHTEASGEDYTPYNGTINWNSGFHTGYAFEDGQNWDPTWSWGAENIPLEFSGFQIFVEEPHSPGYVKLTPGPVPEPATMLLFGTGLIGLAGIGRKKFFGK